MLCKDYWDLFEDANHQLFWSFCCSRGKTFGGAGVSSPHNLTSYSVSTSDSCLHLPGPLVPVLRYPSHLSLELPSARSLLIYCLFFNLSPDPSNSFRSGDPFHPSPLITPGLDADAPLTVLAVMNTCYSLKLNFVAVGLSCT